MKPAPEIAIDAQQVARILIIEDEPLIAENVRAILTDAGFAVVGVASKLEKALTLIEIAGCEAAIVDANLAGVCASPAAAVLAARGLPFIVLSGYAREQLRGDFCGGLYIQKPFRDHQLVEGLNTILFGGYRGAKEPDTADTADYDWAGKA